MIRYIGCELLSGRGFNLDDEIAGGALGLRLGVNLLDGARNRRVDQHLHFHGRQNE